MQMWRRICFGGFDNSQEMGVRFEKSSVQMVQTPNHLQDQIYS